MSDERIELLIAQNHENATRFGQSVLGCLIEEPGLWPQADLSTDDFLVSDHQKIWQAMARLHEDGEAVNITTLADDLGGKVDPAYLSALIDGCVPQNFASYVRGIRKASKEREVLNLVLERIPFAKHEERLLLAGELTNLLSGQSSRGDWKKLFHSYAEVAAAPQPEWLIANFAEVEDIIMIGGPSGHGKSFILLAMCRALLTGKPLFNFAKFKVPAPSMRVVYLVPEVGLRSFRRRLEWFHLLPFVQSEKLFLRTLGCGPVISLTDPRILAAAEGADVFLDTAIRFSEGDESSAADNRDGLAATLFGLGRAGARSVICAHHSPKDFAKQTELTLENCLRGSGDIGAMLSTAYGVRQVDRATNRILISCIKPRDIDPLLPFEIQGRPFIADCGDFRVVTEPSEQSLVERLGASKDVKARLLADELFAEGKSANVVAGELKKRGLGKNRSLISRWQNDFKEQKRAVSEGVSRSVSPLRDRNAETPVNGECEHPFEGVFDTLKSPSLLENSGNTLTNLPVNDIEEFRNTEKHSETLSRTEAANA